MKRERVGFKIYFIFHFKSKFLNLCAFCSVFFPGDDEELAGDENETTATTQNDASMEDIADSESTRSERHSKSNSPELHSHESLENLQSTKGEKRPRDRDEDDNSATSGSPILSSVTSTTKTIPTLRLNAALASDPASNPDAKEFMMKMCVKTEETNENDEDDDVTLINHDSEDVENNLDAVNIRKSPLKLHQPTANSKENNSNQIMVKNLELLPRPNHFMCTPCGIRFSTLSTLEAHQTYYCSHRKDADDSTKSANDVNGGEPPNKAIKTGKQYACTQCSYSADKKVSLNRHMRMHQTSPTPSSVCSNGGDEPQQLVVPTMIAGQVPQVVDRYCSNCDIRFSSTKTYRAHKQHYCSSRHRDG